MIGLKWPIGRLCDHCGASFLAYSNRPRQRFCGLSCFGSARKRLPWIVCPREACGIRFPQRKARQRFCSVECGLIRAPRTLHCPYCTRVVPSRPEQRFCSHRCAALTYWQARSGIPKHVANHERMSA